VRLDVMSVRPIPIMVSITLAVLCGAVTGSLAEAAGKDAVILVEDPAIDCLSCADWNQSLPPFQVFGNTW